MWRVKFFSGILKQMERRVLYISPDMSSWNDFGYRLKGTLCFMYDGTYFDFPIYVVPRVGESKYASDLGEWIASLEGDGGIDLDDVRDPPYVSLLNDIESYERIAKYVSRDDAQVILKKLCDATYLKSSGAISTVFYDHLIYSSEFRLGVLRNAGAWKAFRRGFLNARYTRKLNDAKKNFAYACHLPGFSNAHKINFHFKDHKFFDDRVHCIIGVNGVGKTRYLESLISSMCDFVNAGADFPNPSVLTYSQAYAARNDVGGTFLEQPPRYSYVLCYSSDFDTALPTGCNFGGPFQYRYFDVSARKKEGVSTEPLGLLFADIFRDQNSVTEGRSRYYILKNALLSVLEFENILLPVVGRYIGDLSFQDEMGEKWVRVGHLSGELRSLEVLGAIDPERDITISDSKGSPVSLSSGQRTFLRFSLHFLSYAENGSLIVIDEPETHLHPNLISQFMVLLYRILRATNSIALIATHSVYVVREIPSHCAHILSRDEGGEVSTLQVYTKTLGANVNSLSRAVFEDSTIASYNSKIVSEVAESGLSFEKVLAQYEDIFSLEMLVEIKALMDQQGLT